MSAVTKYKMIFLSGRRWYDFTFEKVVVVGGWLAFICVLDSVMAHAH
jgi:hypothetical protein